MPPKKPVNKPLFALWKKSSVRLPLKGDPIAEAAIEAQKKDWEGVRELEKRPFGGSFDINRMHYADIPAPKPQSKP